MSHLCAICDLRHIKSTSVVWCDECEEGLCVDCREHHSLSKATRQHKTIPTAHFQKSPGYIFEQAQFCAVHNDKYQVFCNQHEQPCCGKCVVDSHKLCKDVVSLSDMIKNIKMSTAFQDVEQCVYNFSDNIKKIRRDYEKSRTSLTNERNQIEREIKKTREKINSYLDSIQEIIVKELLESEENINKTTLKSQIQLQKLEEEIEEDKDHLENMKNNASELTTFLVMKRIGSDVNEKEKRVQAMINDGSLDQVTLDWKIDDTIQNLATVIGTFGKISVESRPIDTSFAVYKTKQAQMMVPTAVPAITIYVEKLQKINTNGERVQDCCLLPNGKTVFSCHSKNCVTVFNKDGSIYFELKDTKSSACFGLAIIDLNTVAVSYHVGKEVCIIDLAKKSIERRIPTDGNCDGFKYRDGTFFLCAHKKGIITLKLNAKGSALVVSCNLPMYTYIALFGGNIFFTNFQTQSVSCCSQSGRLIWEFKNPSFLKNPRGIAVDKDGRVYVIDANESNIVVLSTKGQFLNLIQLPERLHGPQGLYIDSSSNLLLVAARKEIAHLYQIKYKTK